MILSKSQYKIIINRILIFVFLHNSLVMRNNGLRVILEIGQDLEVLPLEQQLSFHYVF